MSKPKAPAAPDYASAAQQQGVANVNSAIASNRLNQIDQIGPTGSLKYTYGTSADGRGYTDPQTGQWIPQVTATTVLSPDQQKLYDQNVGMSTALNDLAARGIGYVDQASNTPIDQSMLPSLAKGLAAPNFSNLGKMPTIEDFNSSRDQVTDAYMERLAPYLKQQRQAMEAKLATQGITHGSEAWKWDQDAQNRGENDQRVAALLAGDQAAQNLFSNAMAGRQQSVNEGLSTFNAGLAGNQFQNAARAQAIQEADYFKNQPLNMLNALRTGNQVSMPTFGNVSGGSQVGATPIYQATADQYQAALDKYKAEMSSFGGLLGGLGKLGSAAIGKWG